MKKNSIFSWIKKADEDLSLAKIIMKEDNFYSHICILCQQAVEKYLKAFIIQRGISPPLTHNLNILADICKNGGLDILEYSNDLRLLSQYYIPAKYPVELPVEFTKDMAKEAIEIAAKIKKLIKLTSN